MSNCTVLLPDSGVVLSGNIINSVIKYIQTDMSCVESSFFYKGFYGNACNRAYLETIPIYYTSEQDLSLKGCLVRCH